MCTCSRHRTLLFGLPRPENVHRCGSGDAPLTRRHWLASASALASLVAASPTVALAKMAGTTIQYDYYSSGILKGAQTTYVLPNGARDVRFKFNDRGRGPELHSRITLDSAGRIATLATTGVNYYKGAVNETFSSNAGGTSWRNVGEQEQHAAAPPRFYVSIDGTPEEAAILARALIAAKDRTLDLWPAGTATLTKVQALEVSNGTAKRSVTMYEIAGLDFAPAQIWLDSDGSLFMQGSIWGAVIPHGWQAVLPQLFEAQQTRSANRNREFARTIPQRSAAAVAITNVALFDSVSATLKPNATVVMKDERVVAAGDGSTAVPSDARTIDGTGKTLLPGLWDMHHHLDGEFGARLLAEGVTTIRDPGNSPEQIVRWQRQFESGELIGPRVVIAGLIDGKGPFTAPIGTTADTPEQVIAQVREWKKLGAVQIKMYSSLKPELVPVAAKEAHSLGMRVSGHVPAFMTAVDAIHGGYDEIQHVNMLFLNFMFDQVKDTRSTARLVEPAKRAASIDLSSEPVKAFIALLKERGIVSDPTLGTFYDDYCARAGNLESSGYADIADWLPAQNRRALITGGMPVPPGMDQRYKDSAQNMMRMVKLLHDSGVQIVPGTDDTLPGFDLIRELSLYSQAGIPNAEVLQLATFAAPKVMKMTDRFGSLEPGKTADAILVHGDPLADVMALRHVGTTIKGGVLYDTRDLYATAGVKAPMA